MRVQQTVIVIASGALVTAETITIVALIFLVG